MKLTASFSLLLAASESTLATVAYGAAGGRDVA